MDVSSGNEMPTTNSTNAKTQNQSSSSAPVRAEIDEFERSKVENYDLEKAIQDLDGIIQECSQMYHQLKQIKYGYLCRTYELYSSIDLPSVLMNACRQEVTQNVPQSKDVMNMDF